MKINRDDVARLFKVGDVIASGGERVEFRLTEVLDDRIRIKSTSSAAKSRLWYSKMSVVMECFEQLDPHRIQSSLAALFFDKKIPISQNETYLYGFVREFRIRAGVARLQDYEIDLDERIAFSKKLPSSERLMRLRSALKVPDKVLVTTTVYRRSPDVIAEVLIRANGICEECGEMAPFIRKNGGPYLEVHHRVQLAKGGEDTVENAVAICPNCHRYAHYG